MDPKKLAVLVEDRSGQPSAGPVPLPVPSDVLYEPAVLGKRGKLCANCGLWAEQDSRCLLMGPDVEVLGTMVCGYHVPGEPQLYASALGWQTMVDPSLAGLIKAPDGGTACFQCKNYQGLTDDSGRCRAVQFGGKPAPVDALGCCSRWAQGDEPLR